MQNERVFQFSGVAPMCWPCDEPPEEPQAEAATGAQREEPVEGLVVELDR